MGDRGHHHTAVGGRLDTNGSHSALLCDNVDTTLLSSMSHENLKAPTLHQDLSADPQRNDAHCLAHVRRRAAPLGLGLRRRARWLTRVESGLWARDERCLVDTGRDFAVFTAFTACMVRATMRLSGWIRVLSLLSTDGGASSRRWDHGTSLTWTKAMGGRA